jgi:hypothetical protein
MKGLIMVKMQGDFWRVSVRVLLAGCLLATSALSAGTPNAPSAPDKAVVAKPKAQKQTASTIKFDAGSGETRAQRSARLKRECKGLPNAGACSGYGS